MSIVTRFSRLVLPPPAAWAGLRAAESGVRVAEPGVIGADRVGDDPAAAAAVDGELAGLDCEGGLGGGRYRCWSWRRKAGTSRSHRPTRSQLTNPGFILFLLCDQLKIKNKEGMQINFN